MICNILHLRVFPFLFLQKILMSIKSCKCKCTYLEFFQLRPYLLISLPRADPIHTAGNPTSIKEQRIVYLQYSILINAKYPEK